MVRQIACELGGQAGARVARHVQLGISATTLLRLVKQTPTPATPAPRLIGVDEFAWKKGQRYGTIIVNHEAHTVLAILPDREVPTVAAWLREHPSIYMVSRASSSTTDRATPGNSL